jgi:four helix bundle protein
METAMEIFRISKLFPVEERYSLTDQLGRSSRSVPANIAEAWRKRRYSAAFVSKLSDAEAEAAESQTHLEIALRCSYLPPTDLKLLDKRFEEILAMLSEMAAHPDRWGPRAVR